MRVKAKLGGSDLRGTVTEPLALCEIPKMPIERDPYLKQLPVQKTPLAALIVLI